MLDENSSQWFCILVYSFVTAKHYQCKCQTRWENLDCSRYRFKPIKFVNLLVPSPCETQPYMYMYNKIITGDRHQPFFESLLIACVLLLNSLQRKMFLIAWGDWASELYQKSDGFFFVLGERVKISENWIYTYYFKPRLVKMTVRYIPGSSCLKLCHLPFFWIKL